MEWVKFEDFLQKVAEGNPMVVWEIGEKGELKVDELEEALKDVDELRGEMFEYKLLRRIKQGRGEVGGILAPIERILEEMRKEGEE